MKSFILSIAVSIICLQSIAQVSINPANPQNPYDYIGSNHNEGLDFIIKKYPNISGRFYSDNWKTIVSDFLNMKQLDGHGFLNVMSNQQVDQKCGPFSFYSNGTPEEELKRYASSGFISQQKYDKAMQVYELVNQVDDLLTQAGGNSAKAYSVFYDRMVKLESGFRSLPSDDQQFCYAISSVARNSIAYWLNESNSSKSAWHIPKSNITGKKFSWAQLGAYDVAGAVSGVVHTFVAALIVAGPLGIGVVGAAAIAAGLGASAGYVIMNILGF